jgi:hypothetical protein
MDFHDRKQTITILYRDRCGNHNPTNNTIAKRIIIRQTTQWPKDKRTSNDLQMKKKNLNSNSICCRLHGQMFLLRLISFWYRPLFQRCMWYHRKQLAAALVPTIWGSCLIADKNKLCLVETMLLFLLLLCVVLCFCALFILWLVCTMLIAYPVVLCIFIEKEKSGFKFHLL